MRWLLLLALGCATPMPPAHASPPEFGCHAILEARTCEWRWRCYERELPFEPRAFDADCLKGLPW